MGGFQKYPIPRFMHIQAWVVNKNWRKNVFHIFAPLTLFTLMVYRNVSISTVKYELAIFINNNFSIPHLDMDITLILKSKILPDFLSLIKFDIKWSMLSEFWYDWIFAWLCCFTVAIMNKWKKPEMARKILLKIFIPKKEF